MDQIGVTEDGFGGGRFGVNGEVGKEAAFGPGKGTGDQVKGGQCDERIPQTCPAVHKDALCGGFHVAGVCGNAKTRAMPLLGETTGANEGGISAGARVLIQS